ncbi:hypothetical protein [Cellulomonas fengjieae]|uniref:Lipoprotein n=1 Tax=Cellulomonas fengjieae TaxID=2819978 RepID=A0ABS3SL44_9CELL|nr:hypothetical protein [Cellulomonas fengjieae]MBO3086468.1 hypothetical protein [Cellulomonas fengjieae]MBO3100463.1 hypothetical protein [Cellulomonas fengjieae]QVI66668.1 hypothetical protein KG102_03455 [Cellulomonas fengjieae]
MKRAAVLFAAAVLTVTTLTACDGGSDAADATATSSASSAPAEKDASPAAPVEPNAALACGRYFNGGESSLNARIAAAVPVLEAQDAGTALDEDQTEELGAISSALADAVKVAPEDLAGAYTSIQERVDGALEAAETGGANAATLDYPSVSATIVTACTEAGFPVS